MRDKVKIETLKEWEADAQQYYAPGALLRVRNGKGILREVFGTLEGKTYLSLMMGMEPLFEFQGDEYFCPTCEKILRSGYGLGPEYHIQTDKINQKKETVPLQSAIQEIEPLLGLLPSGFYVVIDTVLHPTDGNGHIFWDVPAGMTDMDTTDWKGTCLYYFGNGEWGSSRPHFTVATEPKCQCNMERVEYYRKNPGSRAIAYYMDGYMTALLDGHHKTLAAALENRDINALVIIPAHLYWKSIPGTEGYTPALSAGDLSFYFEDLNIGKKEVRKLSKENPWSTRVSEAEMYDIRKRMIKNNQAYELPVPADGIAEHYPDVREQAYIDSIGAIPDELLENILQKRTVYSDEEVQRLMIALSGIHHKRAREMGEFFSRQPYLGETLYVVLEEMMKLPGDEELEAFFIERMVELEGEYPYIRDLILDYL